MGSFGIRWKAVGHSYHKIYNMPCPDWCFKGFRISSDFIIEKKQKADVEQIISLCHLSPLKRQWNFNQGGDKERIL